MPQLSTLRRSSDKRILGGVCGGLAEWLGASPFAVRLGFVAVSFLSAAFPGIVVYVVLWFFIPDAAPGSARLPRSGLLLILLLALTVLIVLIVGVNLGEADSVSQTFR